MPTSKVAGFGHFRGSPTRQGLPDAAKFSAFGRAKGNFCRVGVWAGVGTPSNK